MAYRKNSTGSGIGIGGNFGSLVNRSGMYYTAAGETVSTFYQIEQAEVLEVDLSTNVPQNTGRIKFRFLLDTGADIDTLDYAYPINPSIKIYPVLHETVAISEIYGRYYYECPLNYTNFVNNNSLENVSDANIKVSTSANVKKYTQTQQSGVANKTTKPTPLKLGETFKDGKETVPFLIPKEGDVILQGRFGNYIRLGSNQLTNYASTKISVLHKRETIYKAVEESLDLDTCIWLTYDEQIKFKQPATKINQRNSPPGDYLGKQITLSSDRIILNSKINEILLFSGKGIHLAATKNFSIDTGASILANSKSNIELVSSEGKVLLTAKDSSIISSPKVFIGKDDANEPLVLGNVFMSIFEELLDAMMQEKHVGFSGPPTPDVIAKYAAIKAKLRTMLSKRNYTI